MLGFKADNDRIVTFLIRLLLINHYADSFLNCFNRSGHLVSPNNRICLLGEGNQCITFFTVELTKQQFPSATIDKIF